MKEAAGVIPIQSPLANDELEALKSAESLEQRIDALGQEILANAFMAIDAVKKKGKKQSEKEIIIQEELQRQFKLIQNVYTQLKKMNRIPNGGGNNNDFSKGLLDKIKEKKSSLGAIVTKIGDHVSKKDE